MSSSVLLVHLLCFLESVVGGYVLPFYCSWGKCLYTLIPTFIYKCSHVALASVAQLVEASSCKPKGHMFNSPSGHTPSSRFGSWLGCVREATDRCSLSHPCFSPSLPFSLNINKHFLWWRKIKIKTKKKLPYYFKKMYTCNSLNFFRD